MNSDISACSSPVLAYHKPNVVAHQRFQVSGVELQRPESVGESKNTRTNVVEAAAVEAAVRQIRLSGHRYG